MDACHRLVPIWMVVSSLDQWLGRCCICFSSMFRKEIKFISIKCALCDCKVKFRLLDFGNIFNFAAIEIAVILN